MINIRNTKEVRMLIAKDGCKIKEIFHPRNSPLNAMSLAEAILDPGKSTKYYYHKKSDEIYFILQGTGIVEIDGEKRKVKKNDCILIKAKSKHRIKNFGKVQLRILCFESPPYSDEDTILLPT